MKQELTAAEIERRFSESSLHRELKEAEGVSLNQYMLYKLSR